MNDLAVKNPIDAIKDSIRMVESFIQKEREELIADPSELSVQLSLTSWLHELKRLQGDLAEAIRWEAQTPEERIKCAQDQISALRGLIANGVATLERIPPSILNTPKSDDDQFLYAKSGWESEIYDLEMTIRKEKAKLAS
jgi:hypothetical protein